MSERMASHEDEAAELLWKYIEEIREADDPEAVNFVARTSADLMEYAALLPLADALHETLREAAAEADVQDEPPAALVAAIQVSGRRSIGKNRPSRRPFPVGWRLAVGGLAMMTTLVLLIWRSVPRAPLTTVTLHVQSMIRDHEEFVQNPAKVSVRGSDPAKVAAALSPQIGYTITPADLSLAGAQMLGGRRCTLDGQPIAYFMYRAEGIPVSLYELRAPRCRLPGMAEKAVAGRRYLSGTDSIWTVLAWRMGDRLYVIVSALNERRLIEMAQHVSGHGANDGAGDTL